MDKQYILREIKRTAAASGGRPHGAKRFFTETGIKESDWRGVHWARWGDAIREAGLQPNKKQSAYDESALIETLIQVMREFGRFPTLAELQLKTRRLKADADGSFPSYKTFQRLGSKQQLAVKVQSYCEARPGYDDIKALCEAIPNRPPTQSDDDDSGSKESFGFVYLIKAGRHYKIGRTNALGRRERELGIQLPERANRVHTIRTDDPAGIETLLAQEV